MPRQPLNRVLSRTEEAMGWAADSIKTQQLALEEMQLAYVELRRINERLTQDMQTAA